MAKIWTESKDKYRGDFFELANAAVAQRGLGVKLFDCMAANEGIARQRVEMHNPGFEIDILRHRMPEGIHDETAWEAVLKEDPALKPFSFEHEGYKYSRQISKGPVMVDDDWIAEEDPELLSQVTFDLPWGGYVLRPLEQMDPKIINRLGKYIYNSKPRVSLSVREVKQDDAA